MEKVLPTAAGARNRLNFLPFEPAKERRVRRIFTHDTANVEHDMADKQDSDGKRELIEPHEKRYQRRNDDGTFGESDDQHRSLSQDDRRDAKSDKSRGQGDKGD